MRKFVIALSFIISLGTQRAEAAITLTEVNIIILLGGGVLGLAGGLFKLIGQVHDWCDLRYREGRLCCCCTKSGLRQDLEAPPGDFELQNLGQGGAPAATPGHNDAPDLQIVPSHTRSAPAAGRGGDDTPAFF